MQLLKRFKRSFNKNEMEYKNSENNSINAFNAGKQVVVNHSLSYTKKNEFLN